MQLEADSGVREIVVALKIEIGLGIRLKIGSNYHWPNSGFELSSNKIKSDLDLDIESISFRTGLGPRTYH